MKQHLLRTAHALVTHRTAVLELPGVYARVLREVILAREKLRASVALVRLFLRVREDVALQFVLAVEGLRATGERLERTRVGGTVGRVDEEVAVELVLARELFAALVALVVLDAEVDALLVLRELRGGAEAARTVVVVAHVALDAHVRLLVLVERVFVAAQLAARVARQVVLHLVAVPLQRLLRVELLLAVAALVLASVRRLVRLAHLR